MSSILTIETLSKTHHRSAFECGDELLNHFLQKIARQHNDKGGGDKVCLGRPTTARRNYRFYDSRGL